MAFKVNFVELQKLSSTISTNLEELENAKNKASIAGENAVLAAGGSNTQVGLAVQNAIHDDTDIELNKAKQVIARLNEALLTVSKTYDAQNQELLSKIKSIASSTSDTDSSTTV